MQTQILNKYVLREIWPGFFVTIFVLVFIALAARMLPITEMVINRGVYIGHVGMMILYVLPDIIVFSFPAAILMAVVVAFIRFAADNEIIALKASGISILQILLPVVSFSLLGAAASLAIGLYAVPWGDNSFKDLAFKIAESQGDLGIKERVFSEPFENVTFYVNSFSSQDKVMRDIFVTDNRDKEISNNIVAQEGHILLDPEKRIISLHFSQGHLFIVAKDRSFARAVRFNTYDLSIGLKDILAALRARKKTPKEMSLNELKHQLKSQDEGSIAYNETLIELLSKFSIPLSVFFIGIIGVPLGARLKGRGRSAGIGLSLAVFIAYYAFLGAVRSICETGLVSPKFGVWIPSFFLFVATIYLLWKVSRDRSVNPFKRFYFRAKQGI